MGAWQGRTFDEIRRSTPDAAAAPHSFLWKFQAPGGERLEAMLARLRDLLRDLPGEAILVTHGVTCQLLRGCLLGLGVAEMDALEDGQGVVYHVTRTGETCLKL